MGEAQYNNITPHGQGALRLRTAHAAVVLGPFSSFARHKQVTTFRHKLEQSHSSHNSTTTSTVAMQNGRQQSNHINGASNNQHITIYVCTQGQRTLPDKIPPCRHGCAYELVPGFISMRKVKQDLCPGSQPMSGLGRTYARLTASASPRPGMIPARRRSRAPRH